MLPEAAQLWFQRQAPSFRHLPVHFAFFPVIRSVDGNLGLHGLPSGELCRPESG